MATTAIRAPSVRLGMPDGNMLAACILFLVAFLIRLPNMANPAYEVDEQFYLLVGDRMLHGALPYVDIWDRKPIGLFLIYAAIRLLGGDGMLPVHVVATLFTAATAWLIHRIAYPVAGRLAAIVAGILYLLWIETVEGGGGQSPIFYNMFVAGAAACTLAALEQADHRQFRRLAFSAMALGGLAIQIKYTAVFEIAYFGAVLSWALRRHAQRVSPAITEIMVLAAAALVPTIAAVGYYAAIGQFRAFWFANFTSIFLRSPANPDDLHYRLSEMATHMVALAACYAAGLWHLRSDRRAETRRWQWVVSGWIVAAIAGFFSVGALYFHYMLPLFVPLAIAAAPIFRRRPLGLVMAAIAMWLPFGNLNYPDFATTRYFRSRVDAIQALIPADVGIRCMHMFAGPPILYLRTHACTTGRYLFPDHLISTVETHALGIDTLAEMRRLLAQRPRVLVSDDHAYHLDPGSERVLSAIRARFYHKAGSVEMERHWIDIWVSNQ